jgi:hypothetical protein
LNLGPCTCEEMLYHLNHASRPFFSSYSGDRVSLFHSSWPGSPTSYFTLPALAGMTGAHHHAQHFSVEMKLNIVLCLTVMMNLFSDLYFKLHVELRSRNKASSYISGEFHSLFSRALWHDFL